ncbi:hypothetical protein O181_022275 [Austropuccinia psidii MF-1]|uniref:Uncharacterized protein n=1 Tax=Austropuccinia psidii MF-1 TaxID=1389203 RepID=A0A9Q3GXX6_9BASI|nr:hypothetical protein [Austropuccinia psidii MF-1]
MYTDLLVFERFDQLIAEENSTISLSSKETITPETDRKSSWKNCKKDELKGEDSEAIEKIKEELRKMRINLDMATEDPENWI